MLTAGYVIGKIAGEADALNVWSSGTVGITARVQIGETVAGNAD